MKNPKTIIFIAFFLIIGSIFLLNKPVNITYVANENLSTLVSNDEVTTISFEHNKVHRGELWYILNYTMLGGNENNFIIINTGNTSIHVVYKISNQLETRYEICKNINISTNGTKLEQFNRNKYVTGSSNADFYIGGTFNNCTVIGEQRIGNGKKIGGTDRASVEHILKANSSYAFGAYNLETTENVINYYFEWYEGR